MSVAKICTSNINHLASWPVRRFHAFNYEYCLRKHHFASRLFSLPDVKNNSFYVCLRVFLVYDLNNFDCGTSTKLVRHLAFLGLTGI